MAQVLSVTCLLVALCSVQGALAFYSAGSEVVSLTPSNFEKNMKQSVWLVEFYAPWCGHCQSLKPDWEKAAKALKGIVGVGAVDADEHKSLGQEWGVQGFPTIKLMYTDASDKIKSIDYKGARTAKDIVEWAGSKALKVALNRLGVKSSSSSSSSGSGGGGSAGAVDEFYSGTDVVSLNDGNFHAEVVDSHDMWFVEFYAPWCGHCKSLKPAWIELASNLDGRVRVGAVDCTANQQTCSEYGVQGFPTIKFFGVDKAKPEAYNGERDSGTMAAFALGKWSKEQPAPESRELTDHEVWVEHCLGHEADKKLNLKAVRPKQLCLVAFLPHILDSKAEGRQEYISLLKKVAEAYKDRPFSWFWAEGGAQPKLEATLDVGGYGYPAFIALNPSKAKFAALRSSFNEASLKEFMDAVRNGRERVVAVSGESMAELELDIRAPWDGTDGAESMEEEFSLEDLGIGSPSEHGSDEL